jgi:hypothetical protein
MSYGEGRESSGGSTVIIVLAIIGGIILGIALICGGIAYFAIQKAAPMINAFAEMTQDVQRSIAAAKAFVEDIQSNRLDAAYGMTTEAFQSRMSRKQFEELIAKYPELQDPSVVRKESLRPDLPNHRPADPNVPAIPSFQTVTYLCPFESSDGKEMELSVTVTKEGQAFKVDQFKVAPVEDRAKRAPRRATTTRRSTSPTDKKKMEKVED